MVIISSLPRSMAAVRIHFADSGIFWNVLEGPTMGPRAGPTLAMAAVVAERAVRKSRP